MLDSGRGRAGFVRLTLVLAPLSITRSLVMDAGEEVEVFNWDLGRLDAQLVVEFSLSSAFDAHNGSIKGGASLARDAERV